MIRKISLAAAIALGACLAGAPVAALAQAEEAQASEQEHYSIESTTIGTLLDDPAAAEILERLIPTVYANDIFQTMGRPNTLRTAQQYESAVLTEEKMQEIQAAFDQLAEQRATGSAE